MNLEGVKQSLAKIPAWVKANPKKAAVIAVIIIVIAYFAIKRGASDSGDENTTSAPESLDSMGGGLSALGPSGSSGGAGSETSTPATPTTTTTTTTESSGGDFDGGGINESDFSMSAAPSGFVNNAPAYSGGAAAIISNPTASFKPASTMTGVKSVLSNTGVAQSNNALKKVEAALKVNNSVAPAKTTPVITSKLSNSLANSGRAEKISTPKTDAEKSGLSKYFTGVSGGRRYVAGAYVGAAVVVSKKSDTLKKVKAR